MARRGGDTNGADLRSPLAALLLESRHRALRALDVPFAFLMVDGEHPKMPPPSRAPRPRAGFGPGGRRAHGHRSAAIIDISTCTTATAPPMVPADPRIAIEARQMDGIFDDYVMSVVTRMVLSVLRDPTSAIPMSRAR